MPAKRSAILGQTFGLLTASHFVEGYRPYVFCRCKCGGSRTVRADVLGTGRIQDCGCVRKSHRVYLSHGDRYGDWMVLEPPLPRDPPTHALCKCKCGTIREVAITNLRSGQSKSCGCSRRREHTPPPTGGPAGPRKIPSLNSVWGMLTVLSILPTGSNTTALCRCECGQTKEVWAANLRAGLVVSCGCTSPKTFQARCNVE